MEVKKNITSIFMVPTLRVPKDALRGNGFINAYVKDSRREDVYKESIYLLFKPEIVKLDIWGKLKLKKLILSLIK